MPPEDRPTEGSHLNSPKIWESPAPTNMHEQRVRIATFVNIMRKRKLEEESLIGISYAVSDFPDFANLEGWRNLNNLMNSLGDQMGSGTKSISTVQIEKEFTLEDADRLITQLMSDAGLNPNHQQARAKFAPKIFENNVIEDDTLVRVNPDDYISGDTSYLGQSQNVLLQADNQLWNDSTILLDGELLAYWVNTGIQQGFIGKSPYEQRSIRNRLLNLPSHTEYVPIDETVIGYNIESDQIVNYLIEFWSKKDSIRTYLATGNVLDEN